jgi:hypothetical protein
MPNIQYTIQLQSEGISSGPYYVVTYSTGSGTYFPVLAGSPVYLPDVGNTAIVQIPSASYTTLLFKLNNGIGSCELCDNDVVFVVTGSEPTSSCCTPTLNSVTLSGSFANVAFTLPTGSCLSCSAVTIQTSTDGTTWGGNFSGGCTSPRAITAPTASCSSYTTYYRLYQTCSGSVTSSFSNTGSLFTSASEFICCVPSITSIALSGSSTSSLFVNYSAGATGCCLTCSFITLTTSSNGTDWGGAVTASCTGSQFLVAAPACNTSSYYRLQQTCSGSVTSSFSATGSFTYSCPPEAYYYYSVNQYSCDGCLLYFSGLVARSSVARSTTNGYFYNPFGDGFVYQIQTEITPAPFTYDIDISSAPSDASCTVACSI